MAACESVGTELTSTLDPRLPLGLLILSLLSARAPLSALGLTWPLVGDTRGLTECPATYDLISDIIGPAFILAWSPGTRLESFPALP